MSETTSSSLPEITSSSSASSSVSSTQHSSHFIAATLSPSTTSAKTALPSLTSATAATGAATTSYSSIAVKIPSQEITNKNPFVYHSNFKEGTFYVIALPILGSLLVFYLLGVACFRWRSKRHASDVESRDDFDDDYLKSLLNYDDNNSFMFKGSESASMFTGSGSSNGFTVNPSNASTKDGFVKKHMKRFSASLGMEIESDFPVETEFSRSEMAMLQRKKTNSVDLLRDDPSFYHGVYQTDVTQFQNFNDDSSNPYTAPYPNQSQPIFQLNSTNEYIPTAPNTPYGLTAAPTIAATSVSGLGFSLPEPGKAKTQEIINKPNTKTHFHKKTLSSLALDEFISTGQLPNNQVQRVNTSTLDPFAIGNDSTNDLNIGNSSILISTEPERHSMYENPNLSYSSLQSSPLRGGHNKSRSVSPVRKDNQSTPSRVGAQSRGTTRGHASQDSFSRGESMSPVRGGSPIRNDVFRSPAKRKLFFHQQQEAGSK